MVGRNVTHSLRNGRGVTNKAKFSKNSPPSKLTSKTQNIKQNGKLLPFAIS